MSVAFSRADAAVAFDGKAHVVGPGQRRRVDDVIRSDEHATALWELLRPVAEGGRGGHAYVCGSARFAASVMQALTDVVRRGTGSAAAAREFVRGIVAEGRLGQDVFTTYLGHAQQGATFEISDLATRNTPEAGFWMAVGGAVYDVGEFVHLHVGGPHIVRNHVGLDATAAYRQVLHHVHAEVDAQLAMYEIGHLRRLQFGGRWGIVLTEDGLRSLPLEELFTTWVRFLYLVVGMENALAADFGFTTMTATRGEDPRELTPFKAQYVLEAHRRFLISYLDGLLEDDLRTLWQLTVGFCDPHVDVRSFDTDLADLVRRPEHRLVRGSVATAKDLLRSGEDRGLVAGLCRTYVHADAQILREIKQALSGGIRAFEQHEADVVELGGADLLAALRGAVDAVSAYYRRLADHTRGLGITAAADPVLEAIPADRGLPGHGGPLG